MLYWKCGISGPGLIYKERTSQRRQRASIIRTNEKMFHGEVLSVNSRTDRDKLKVIVKLQSFVVTPGDTCNNHPALNG